MDPREEEESEGARLLAQATALFRACDLNGDGVLSRRELSKALTLHVRDKIASVQLPQLTELLKPARVSGAVQRMDSDGDNIIDLDEFLDFIDGLVEERSAYERAQKMKRLSKEKRAAALKRQKLEHETYCARLGFLAFRLRLSLLRAVRSHGRKEELAARKDWRMHGDHGHRPPPTRIPATHLAANFASAEVVATLFFHVLRWDPKTSDKPLLQPDVFVLSDGRLAPLWFAALRTANAAGITQIEGDAGDSGGRKEKTRSTSRKRGSPDAPIAAAAATSKPALFGRHSMFSAMPTARGAPYVRVASAGGGFGMAGAAGIAWVRRGRGRRRCICLLSSDEMARGAFWETARLCVDESLINLLAVVLFHDSALDHSGVGQGIGSSAGGTRPGQRGGACAAMAREKARLGATGWEVFTADDGNTEVEDFLGVLTEAQTLPRKPTAVLIRVAAGSGWRDLEKQPNRAPLLLQDREAGDQLERRLERLAKGAGSIRPPKLPARSTMATPLRSSRPSSRAASSSGNAGASASAASTAAAAEGIAQRQRERDLLVMDSLAGTTFGAALAQLRGMQAAAASRFDAVRASGGIQGNGVVREGDDADLVTNELIVLDARDGESEPLPFLEVDVFCPGATAAAVGFATGACSEGRRVVVVGPASDGGFQLSAVRAAGMTLCGSGAAHRGPEKKKRPDAHAASYKKRVAAMKENPEHLRALALAGIVKKEEPATPLGLESRGRLVLVSTSSGLGGGDASCGWGGMEHTDIARMRTVPGMVVFVPCDETSTRELFSLALEHSPDPPANWRLFYIRCGSRDADVVQGFAEARAQAWAGRNREAFVADWSGQDGGRETHRPRSDADDDVEGSEDLFFRVYTGAPGEGNGVGPGIHRGLGEWRFRIGGSNVLRRTFDRDKLTLVACGRRAVSAVLSAHSALRRSRGIHVRVIDLYCLSPIDRWALLEAIAQTRFVITVEDHGVVGGLSDAVGAVCAIERRLALDTLPELGGTREEVLREAQLEVGVIVEAVVGVLRRDTLD